MQLLDDDYRVYEIKNPDSILKGGKNFKFNCYSLHKWNGKHFGATHFYCDAESFEEAEFIFKQNLPQMLPYFGKIGNEEAIVISFIPHKTA